jgi:hypothetical protein
MQNKDPFKDPVAAARQRPSLLESESHASSYQLRARSNNRAHCPHTSPHSHIFLQCSIPTHGITFFPTYFPLSRYPTSHIGRGHTNPREMSIPPGTIIPEDHGPPISMDPDPQQLPQTPIPRNSPYGSVAGGTAPKNLGLNLGLSPLSQEGELALGIANI